MKISNCQASESIDKLQSFTASNIFAEWYGSGRYYVVFSYGYHFPIYVHDIEANKWYGNKNKYSRSTSKHQTQARPSGIIDFLNTEELKAIYS